MYRGDKGRRRGGFLFESGPTVTVPAAAGAAAAASSLGHESAGVRAGIGKPGRHIKLAAQVPDAGSLSGHRRSSSPRQRRRGRHGVDAAVTVPRNGAVAHRITTATSVQ